MYTFKIFWEKNGQYDFKILTADSIDLIQKEAAKIIEKINPENYWSEQIRL